MNHQPFESWLLDDKYLSATEKRELASHLRDCRTCTALAETGLALRSAKVTSPAAGFTLRFQQRLAAQKVAERRRKLWGLIIPSLRLLLKFLARVISFFLEPSGIFCDLMVPEIVVSACKLPIKVKSLRPNGLKRIGMYLMSFCKVDSGLHETKNDANTATLNMILSFFIFKIFKINS